MQFLAERATPIIGCNSHHLLFDRLTNLCWTTGNGLHCLQSYITLLILRYFKHKIVTVCLLITLLYFFFIQPTCASHPKLQYCKIFRFYPYFMLSLGLGWVIDYCDHPPYFRHCCQY